ncbi:hypothetical protein F5887DRAFT_899522, partial [Amanita rubescens]
PVFCYDESKYDPENPKQGLLQGHFLLRVYRHVFSGPSSALQNKTKGRSSRGQKNSRLPAPTPETIGYAAILARWALSASPLFGEEDINFRLDDFYYCILELLDEEAPTRQPNEEFDKSWAEATLAWWRE